MVNETTKTFSALELWSLKDDKVTSNLTINNENSLSIISQSQEAIYQSVPVELKRFKELVLSWNVKQLGTSELTYYVALGDGFKFGHFHVMGIFEEDNSRSMNSVNDNFASVSIDTLINKNNLNNRYIVLKVSIIPNNNASLLLENISITSKPIDSNLIVDESKMISKRLEVKSLQQMSVANIGSVICSPTSVAMVLNYYGYHFSQTQVAKKVFDHNKHIYGNWSFNASYAGSLGNLNGRVEYINNFSQLIHYINNDIPVVLSIKTTSKEQLTGTLMAYPSGHLVVLIGFEQHNGDWYGIVNDPAEREDAKVERKYLLSELLDVWSQYAYIIVPKNYKFQ